MKKILLLLTISFTLLSCGIEDNQYEYLSIVPVKSVEMPTAYKVDSITQIPISYLKPTPCHQFSNFYYNSIGNERTVAIYCVANNTQDCAPNTDYITTVPLNFKPNHAGIYKFRFWTGVNVTSGVDEYIEHEITVNN